MTSEQEFPLSIYLQLEQGELADLEVVSEASIHLINAMKDVVAFVDPSARVRIVVQNGEEGSLRLNSLIKLITASDYPNEIKKAHHRGLAIGLVLTGIIGWLPGEIGSHYIGKALDYIDEKMIEALEGELEEEDLLKARGECREIVDGVSKNGDAAGKIRKFYSTLQKDESIVGVGLGGNHDAPPDFIVPRDQFAIRARGEPEEAEPDERTRIEHMNLVLIQPRLTADNRAWRFAANGFEFGAKVLDQEFLIQTLSGQRELPLREGLVINAEVELHEVRSGEIWIVKSRSVIRVNDVSSGPSQASLL